MQKKMFAVGLKKNLSNREITADRKKQICKFHYYYDKNLIDIVYLFNTIAKPNQTKKKTQKIEIFLTNKNGHHVKHAMLSWRNMLCDFDIIFKCISFYGNYKIALGHLFFHSIYYQYVMQNIFGLFIIEAQLIMAMGRLSEARPKQIFRVISLVGFCPFCFNRQSTS